MGKEEDLDAYSVGHLKAVSQKPWTKLFLSVLGTQSFLSENMLDILRKIIAFRFVEQKAENRIFVVAVAPKMTENNKNSN